MSAAAPRRLGEILLQRGIITYEELEEALTKQKTSKKKLGEILVENGAATDEQITEALDYAHNLPLINLEEIEIGEKLLSMFNYPFLKKHNLVPVQIEEDCLVVATNDPLDLAALQEIRTMSGYRVKTIMASLKTINECLDKFYGPLRSAKEAIKEVKLEKGTTTTAKKKDSSLKELESAAQETPVVKLVNSVISDAIKQKASDIHFEPRRENLRVRFRVDGVLHERMTVPQELQSAVISRIKIVSGMDIAERRKPQDGRVSLSGEGGNFDIRVSTLPDIFGEKVVLRLLDKESVIRSLESLGMDREEFKTVNDLIFKPYGMLLVTGPTGSGKTTTLYSVLNILNDESRNIVTVEDPVEYELDGINQTHINVRAGYTFATAIRHILRQDPDVIMIGEIRDLETAEIAIQAALTGHMVFSTLHTNSASGAITRLLDMNVEPFLIGSAVIGVVAQRLVRKLCPHCKEEYVAPPEVMSKFPEMMRREGLTLARPKGCKKCYKLGYSGRLGIYEILVMDEVIREMVLRRANETDIAQAAIEKGMKKLKTAGLRKALEKVTSLEEVMRVTFVES